MQRELAPHIYLIKLSGPLTAGQGEQVSRCFHNLFVRGVKQVVVNLAEVPFMDAPGLKALITGYQLFGRTGQKFQLMGLQDQPKLVLELTGFEHIFQILGSAAEINPTEWSRQTCGQVTPAVC
jgi:anti-anti-sigma factor